MLFSRGYHTIIGETLQSPDSEINHAAVLETTADVTTAYRRQTFPERGVVRSCDQYKIFGAAII